MINLFFFLKFKSQLRKTRPDLVKQIDESLVNSISAAGGKITGDRFVISAVFNEDTIGFWLDMYILIENVKKNIDESRELFGFSLVICGKYPDSPELLCRFLSSYNGVFTDDKVSKKLFSYASFEKSPEWMKKNRKKKYDCGNFSKLKELKIFKASGKSENNFQNDAVRIFEQKNNRNMLILGPAHWQIRGGLYKYNSKLNGAFPPLKICFEIMGIGSLVDVWSQDIRSLEIHESASRKTAGNLQSHSTEEIDSLWDFLFRERIRDEVSEYVYRCVRRFLSLILNFYINTAVKKNKTPVLMLENIHLAEDNILFLFLDVLAEMNNKNRHKLLLLGTGDADISSEKLKQCEDVFGTIKKISDTRDEPDNYPELPADLWEIVYAISLFSCYFSPELFQRLFEENNKNPVMITRAFSILHLSGIIYSLREPRLIKMQYGEYSFQVLGEKTGRIKAMVCGRLLDWAVRQNINPCFRLLKIVSEYAGAEKINDLFILKSFSSDIVNKTVLSIEAALNSGQFDELLTVKTNVISQVFFTTNALNSKYEKEITEIFENIQPGFISSVYDTHPVLKSKLIVNHCAYFLGQHDDKKASEKAKEAILLGQNKNSFCLPQAYRLYSLVCLSRQRINETIEYIGFALANAEKNGNYHELAVSAYYASVAHFLYGDIFKSINFARKSIEQSLIAGSPEWVDRSRFLEGRIKFELGHYREACDIFDKLLREPNGSRLPDKEKLFAAWNYRCKIYFLNPGIPKPDYDSHDADLFEIEAAYLAEDYQKAVKLSSSYVNPFSNENFLYIEQADWRSGFDQCEHLYFSRGEIQNRMVTMFYSLALSRLKKHDDSSDNDDETIQTIQNVLRDGRLCEIDPWEAFYFFAKYRILEQSRASHVDMSTAVSMAFKRLQRRACRIEDVDTRQQYLNGPRWNRELSQAAKEFKLI